MHANGLGESLGDESGLVVHYGAICIALEAVSPLASNDVGTLWWANNLPGSFFLELGYLTAHGFLPVGSIGAGACLCFVFRLNSGADTGGHGVMASPLLMSMILAIAASGTLGGSILLPAILVAVPSPVCMCQTYCDGLFDLAPCPSVAGVCISFGPACWSLAVPGESVSWSGCLGMDWVSVASFALALAVSMAGLVHVSVGCVAGMPITWVVSMSNLTFILMLTLVLSGQ